MIDNNDIEQIELEKKSDLEIHISEKTINSSVMNVSWCITPELINKIGNNVAYIVITVVPKNMWYQFGMDHVEKTIVVPLSSLMAYVPIKYPGDNYIVANVVTTLAAKAILTVKTYGIFDRKFSEEYDSDEIINIRPELSEGIKYNLVTPQATDIVSVNVPEEVFAPSPPEWEKEWVNHWFSSKPDDQCNFRRRRLVAYTIQPIWALLMVLIRFIWATIVFSVGNKINAEVIYKVLTKSTDDVAYKNYSKTGTSRWAVIPYVNNDWKHLGSFFAPAFWLAYIATSVAVGNLYGFPLVLLSAIVIVAVIIISMYIIHEVKIFNAFSDWLEDYFLRKEQIRMAESTEALVCGGKKLKNINDIPRHNRTISLRFQDLKSKVCKPYGK